MYSQITARGNKHYTFLTMKSLFIASIGLVISVVCKAYIYTEGLNTVFLLPLSFAFMRLIFLRAFSYWKDNIALSIIFLSIYVRYLVAPFFIALSGSGVTTVSPSAFYYKLSVIIMILELTVTLLIIDQVWTKYKKKHLKKVYKRTNFQPAEFHLSWSGFLCLIAILVLIFSRGHLSNVFSHYSTWWSISEDRSELYFYDLIAVDLIKSVLAIWFISFFAKNYRNSKSWLIKKVCFLLSLIVAVAMTMFYQYTLRTALVQLFLSVMIMMIAFFPDQRRLLLTIFGIGGVAFTFFVFSTGTMRFDDSTTKGTVINEIAKNAELYVSGPTMVAITQEKYEWVRSQISFSTYFSEIVNSVHIFGMFPFLRSISDLVSSVPTANELFVDSLGGLTYILPNYSYWSYLGTNLFGGVFEVVSIYFTVKLISFSDWKRRKTNDACLHYSLTYTDILLGQVIFVNNTFLFTHAFTNLPLWLLIFFWVNAFGNRKNFRNMIRGY